MNKKIYLWTLSTALVFSGAALFSCVDRDYVVKDVDLGMEIAPGGLKIPLAVIPKETLEDRLKEVNNIIEWKGYYAVEAKATRNVPVSGENINTAAIAASLLDMLGSGGLGTRAGDDPLNENNWEDLKEYEFHGGQLDPIDFSEYLSDFEVIRGASDMVSPEIFLTVTNPAPIAATIDMSLNLKDENDEQLHAQSITFSGDNRIEPATADGETKTRFHIAVDGVDVPPGHDFADHAYKTVKPENFGDFLKTIPYTLLPAYKVGALPGIEYNVGLLNNNQNYDFGIDYEIIFPLSFGPGMQFAARLTEPGMNGVFSGVSNLGVDIEEIGVLLELETTLRLKIEGLVVEFLNAEGEPVPGVTATVGGAIEGPASDDAEARKSTLGIELVLDGELDVLSQIHGMSLYLPLGNTAAEGGVMGLRPADFLQGRVWVTLPGGVNVDLNELMK